MIHQRKKGFTLIELIIAITILAILAVGLIAALDPVEQINKSRDSVRRDQTIQIAEALERFYALHENYLAGVTHINTTDLQGTVVQPVPDAANEAKAMVLALSSLGELKDNFHTINNENMKKTWIYLKTVGTLETPVVCTEVSSKAMSSQANLWTMKDAAGTGIGTSLTIHMPTNGEFPASSGNNCALASGTARNYCAFCVELSP